MTSASELTPYERLAGLIIALQFINRDPAHQRFNWAWASQELLARTIGLSRRTVCSAMKRLEEFEVLVIDHRGGRRPGSSLCYTLGMDKLDRLPRPAAAEHEQNFTPAVKENRHRVVQTTTLNCTGDPLDCAPLH